MELDESLDSNPYQSRFSSGSWTSGNNTVPSNEGLAGDSSTAAASSEAVAAENWRTHGIG